MTLATKNSINKNVAFEIEKLIGFPDSTGAIVSFYSRSSKSNGKKLYSSN